MIKTRNRDVRHARICGFCTKPRSSIQFVGMTQMKGSATVEGIIVLGILLPIVSGVVMVGKLIDLRQTSEQAARYATWQSTVSARDSVADNQAAIVTERFFSDSSLPLLTDSSPDESQPVAQNALWGSREAPRPATLQARSHVELQAENGVLAAYRFDLSAAPVASSLGGYAERIGGILDSASGNSWGIAGNGLVRADIDVGLQSSDWLGGTNSQCMTTDSGACVRTSSVIMADGWSASSDEHARQRVRSLMPTSSFQAVGDVVADLGGFLLFPELRGLRGAFGHVDMSVLPEYAER